MITTIRTILLNDQDGGTGPDARGTRIPVALVLRQLVFKLELDELFASYPRLTIKVCAALKACLGVRPLVTTDQVFVSKFRTGMSQRAIQAMAEKYFRLANIHDASVHTIGHTFGTHHAARGASLTSIQHALGHNNIKTTSIYLHTAKAVKRREFQEHAL